MSDLFTGVEHIGVSAKSPEALTQFYVEALGFKVKATIQNGDGTPPTYLAALGNIMLEIMPADRVKFPREKPNTEPGIVHLAISVSNFEKAIAHLQNTAARPEGEERAGTFGSRIRFYRDPEGNLFHILYRPQVLV
jgi:glyoxylase I family protein